MNMQACSRGSCLAGINMGIVDGTRGPGKFEAFVEFFRRVNLRLIIVAAVIIALGAGLISRLFTLQIVNGEDYMNNFQLRIRREISLPSTRGNIYDRNGKLLAYNELAYSVTLSDVEENDSKHDHSLNETIGRAIDIIESNGDSVTTDFNIRLNNDNEYEYTVSGRTLLRFLADVCGHKTIDELTDEEKELTADEILAMLGRRFGIGEYANVDSDSYSTALSALEKVAADGGDGTAQPAAAGALDPEAASYDGSADDEAGAEKSGETEAQPVFVPGKGYNRKRFLQLVTIRYLVNLNSYQRYVPTTIATDVSENTVAAILENTNNMSGIDIRDQTARRYVDATYFAQILGYTGRINTEELEELSQEDPSYDSTDVVGKSGIEKSMESQLQGKKGTQTVYVDNLGNILETTNVVEPLSGNDVYLTIDKDLQEAAYDILEKELSNIILAKLENIRTFKLDEDESTYKIVIPIYDVYYAVIRNNVISLDHMSGGDAGDVEREIYARYTAYAEDVAAQLRDQMTSTLTPYSMLTDEYKDYESYIIQALYSNNVIDRSRVDEDDETYIAWTKDETIPMAQYLKYAISQDWVNVSNMEVEQEYSSADEVYQQLVDYIIRTLSEDRDFVKHIYHYMILSDTITGKEVCDLLMEQGCVNVGEAEKAALAAGTESGYQFMRNRIENLDLTPAQLNLDPYSGSMVITDVNTGDVLAMVSYPSFDNNRMANQVDADYYEQLRNDNSHPLINYATQQRTAPGSTFKPLVATAGLLEGAITTDTTVDCTGVFTKIGQPEPHCWIYPSAHGVLNLAQAIHNSCNDYFYEVGYRLGLVKKTAADAAEEETGQPGSADAGSTGTENGTGADGEDTGTVIGGVKYLTQGITDADDPTMEYISDIGISKLSKYADLYGLDEKSGVEIEEASPKVSTEDAVRSAIGQGNSNYTTVGLARYITAVANSGTCFDLTLVRRVENKTGDVLVDNAAKTRNVIRMDTTYWNAIHQGMRLVVEGMSFFSGFPVDVAGKTGTAQEAADRPDHALFVCYAPYEMPQIAVATRIANGYTSTYAAQTTQEVLRYYFGLADKEEILSEESNITAPTGAND